jgi:glycosyltransferase involved in cell wall biosynthesis
MTHSRLVDDPAFRVALDVAPVRAQPAGVGIYVSRLAAALAEQLPAQLALLGRRPDAALDGMDGLPGTPFRRRHYHAWMQLQAVRSVRRLRVDLVHYTNAAAPLVGSAPYVLTVHDLSVLRMPRSHPVLRLATLPVTVTAALRARRLIVPSQATAGELRRVLRIDPDKIIVVPHAATPRTMAEAPAAAPPLGLASGGYLVAVGTVEPRKNHRRLIEAFELLVRRGHDLRLVICGDLAWGSRAVRRAIEASPQRERIVVTGYATPEMVSQLIVHSAAMCYVSLYEGYGLPISEAMAAGAAVVTSNTSSMPEVAGGAAVLVDPLDVAAIADGIEQALSRREELVAAGLALAASRSWSDVARETIAVYKAALEA